MSNASSSFFLKTAEETVQLGKEFAATLSNGSCVFLRGELGAGKTTFVKGMAEAFQCSSKDVSSPTFQYLHMYEGTKTIFHFDLYRLQNEASFFDLGLHEFVGGDGISCIEWPERLETFRPKGTIDVTILHDEEGRCIKICQK
jgi:tRNA threonylcarbamoyladenosine biosynthesis protein TsaE